MPVIVVSVAHSRSATAPSHRRACDQDSCTVAAVNTLRRNGSTLAKSSATKSAAAKASAKARPTTKLALASALVANAKAAHAGRMAELRKQALSAVARIRQSQADIASNIVDIGLSLVELRGAGMAEALGRKGFGEICEKDLHMSVTTAGAFMQLATKVPREVVVKLGPTKAHAVLALVEATPEDDSVESLLNSKLRLPSGKLLDVARATAAEVIDATKQVRAAHATRGGRGFTTMPAEKHAFNVVAEGLRAAGFAKATLVASRSKASAKVRFEVPLAELAQFFAAGRKLVRGADSRVPRRSGRSR